MVVERAARACRRAPNVLGRWSPTRSCWSATRRSCASTRASTSCRRRWSPSCALAQLWERTGPSPRQLVADRGDLDIERLVTLTRGRHGAALPPPRRRADRPHRDGRVAAGRRAPALPCRDAPRPRRGAVAPDRPGRPAVAVRPRQRADRRRGPRRVGQPGPPRRHRSPVLRHGSCATPATSSCSTGTSTSSTTGGRGRTGSTTTRATGSR